MPKLFLLKPDFLDANMDKDAKFYCPSCAQVLGIITYYPQLKEKLEIIFIDFKRPRKEIVELIGEENQGCPNLILSKDEAAVLEDTSYLIDYGDYFFQNNALLIAEFLAEVYDVGVPH
mgnify:CR=1 FL=1